MQLEQRKSAEQKQQEQEQERKLLAGTTLPQRRGQQPELKPPYQRGRQTGAFAAQLYSRTIHEEDSATLK